MNSKKVLIILVIVIVILAAIAIIVATKKTTTQNPKSASQIPLTKSQILTANWKTYTIKTVGIEFKLPQTIASLGTLTEEVLDLSKVYGDTGKILCIHFRKNGTATPSPLPSQRSISCTFSANDIFTIGGSSADSKINGVQYLTEMQGFRYGTDKKYYIAASLKNNLGYPIANQLISYAPSTYFSAIELDGSKLLSNQILFGNFVKNSVGGVVTIKNAQYPALSFQAISTVMNPALLSTVLTTVKNE